MMQNILSFTLLLVLCNSVSANSAQYWVTFAGAPRGGLHPPGGAKFLMKIDALGNIVIPPKKVVTNSSGFVSPRIGATALSHNGTHRLDLWFASRRLLPDFTHVVFHSLIDKRTLRPLSRHPTPLRTVETSYIQASQKKVNDFLAIQVVSPPAAFVGISLSVPRFAQRWSISAIEVIQSGAVSADGKVFFFSRLNNNRNELYLQRLGSQGRPLGSPLLLLRLKDTAVFDVSSILPGGKRYCLYRGDAPLSDDPLLLQIVDSEGKKIGEKIRIANAVGPGQSTAIEPRGQFVIYISDKRGFDTELLFQALDATGHPSGAPKKLAEDVEAGVDILKE